MHYMAKADGAHHDDNRFLQSRPQQRVTVISHKHTLSVTRTAATPSNSYSSPSFRLRGALGRTATRCSVARAIVRSFAARMMIPLGNVGARKVSRAKFYFFFSLTNRRNHIRIK